jgi:hypothetical protein
MSTEIVAAENPPVLALVAGQPVTELPVDLYIPPEALEVFLEEFGYLRHPHCRSYAAIHGVC